jgi:demethylmenaquinone methyltransferase/2-methoxy-6-polyprenyl-1,4-benzoquinol methylase
VFGKLYGFYSRRVLPLIGGALSGSRDAYSYLPASIEKFPSAEDLASRMRATGFRAVEFIRMTGGTVALHLGTK